ncbi:MAG: DUF3971 domain-containing protein [Alphaproteobacteria bacterium]|nr:DUF3971 domain-containing protein [Alphaproteobacteria bacterium]
MNKKKQQKSSGFRHLANVLGVVLGVVLAALMALGFLLSTGVSAPGWVRARLEAVITDSLPRESVTIGDIRVTMFKTSAYPTITLTNIKILDQNGNIRAAVPEIRTELVSFDALTGRLRPVSVVVSRAQLHLRRDLQGKIDISIGTGEAASFLPEGGSVADILAAIEDIFNIPVLSRLQTVQTLNSTITLDDATSGRTWKFKDTAFSFANSAKDISGQVTFKLETVAGPQTDSVTPAGAGDASGQATFSWSKERGKPTSEFSTSFSGFRTEDIADQMVALDWLRVLDAPIAGSVSLNIDAQGNFGQMNGVLDIGAGSLRQTKEQMPTRFSGAKIYLSYDQTQEKLSFDQITIDTAAAHIMAEGHAYLGDRIDRSVGAIIAQLKFTKVELSPQGMFAKPLKFDMGALDMRVQLSPLKIDIGQMVLVDKETSYILKGSLSAGPKGWTSALDLSVANLSHKRMMEIWPLTYKTKTRDWLQANIFAGDMSNITAALRGKPGKKPKITLGFDVSGLSLRFMRNMPPIERGKGYGVLANNQMTMVLQQGVVIAPDGGEVNLADSSMVITDVRIKKSPAVVKLKTQSAIPSLLSLLDLKPFRFLSKSGTSVDIAQGSVKTTGTIEFPLSNKVTFDQVTLAISGDMRGVTSTKLVKGKTLTADQLDAFVDNSGMTISGRAQLGKLPISGVWTQNFGPANKGKSRFEGQVELSQKFLDEFDIVLPKGSVKGTGTGHVTIDIVRAKPPTFKLVSDLNRLALAIDPLGWRKPRNVRGTLTVEGSFGSPPKIDVLDIKTQGLEAEGMVSFKPNGKLDVVRFTKVDIDGWMKAPLEIRIDKNGNAAFSLTGGVIDFRKSKFGDLKSEKGSEGNKITTRLDRLILSSGLSLTDIEGDLTSANGVTGSFSGKVNGGARVVGTLAPQNGGTAVRFTSSKAGEVLRSAGVFSSAVGGRMDMVLLPTGEEGKYDGTLKIKQTRVRNASALADILSAISVVGLLEQLGGDGIAFSDINAKFELNPDGVVMKQSSAIGASLGLTMEGTYDFAEQTMNMSGVITPIYLLNGLLEQSKIFGGLFGRKKGEGLFGFTYTLKGNVDAPKVGVNPLSILTPGLFREIFRQPIPKTVRQDKSKKVKKKPKAPVVTINPDEN